MSTIFLARHADRDITGADGLSPRGLKRAADLASILAPLRINRIFVSSFKRTQQTAEPLALRTGISPLILDDPSDLASAVVAFAPQMAALIIGHSDTIPDTIARLGGLPTGPHLSDQEFDNLFIFVHPNRTLVHLKYGD